MKNIPNGDQWQEGPAVIESRVFETIYKYLTERRRDC